MYISFQISQFLLNYHYLKLDQPSFRLHERIEFDSILEHFNVILLCCLRKKAYQLSWLKIQDVFTMLILHSNYWLSWFKVLVTRSLNAFSVPPFVKGLWLLFLALFSLIEYMVSQFNWLIVDWKQSSFDYPNLTWMS